MPVGRPTKLTPETQKKITDALSAGNTRKAAYEYAGISHETFADWMKRFPAFSEAVTRAEANAEVGFVAVIAKAAKDGDWRASESWLKRRRRDEWGDSIAVGKLSDDDLIAFVAGGLRGDVPAGTATAPGESPTLPN